MGDILRDDAKKFISLLVGDCDPGTDDHAWRKCRRCLAIHEVQTYGAPAMRMLNKAAAALSAPAGEATPADLSSLTRYGFNGQNIAPCKDGEYLMRSTVLALIARHYLRELPADDPQNH